MTAPMFRRLAATLLLILFAVSPGHAVEIKEVVSPKGIRAWLVQDDFVPADLYALFVQGRLFARSERQGRSCQFDDRAF